MHELCRRVRKKKVIEIDSRNDIELFCLLLHLDVASIALVLGEWSSTTTHKHVKTLMNANLIRHVHMHARISKEGSL